MNRGKDCNGFWKVKVLLERESCTFLITLLDGDKEPDCLIQTDFEYPSLARALGWKSKWCGKDEPQAIDKASKWLNDRVGCVLNCYEENVLAYFRGEEQ